MRNETAAMPDDSYLFRLTDCTGIFQHAQNGVPDPSEGYTTDDNARALMMAALLYETAREPKYLDLAYRYLSFLLYAQNGVWFRNFMDYSRTFKEAAGSQDCFGRCIWSLGFIAGRAGLPDSIRRTADHLLRNSLPGCRELHFPRSKAYALLGLALWHQDAAAEQIRALAREIAELYRQHMDGTWRWFEDSVTYCNAVLPLSMLTAWENAGEEEYRRIGLESLDFLLKATFQGETFHPVGCKGWMPKGKAAAEYDQQPVEACGTLLACLKAYRLTENGAYRERARECLAWYTGRNSESIPLIDPETGGCMDGLLPRGINRNQGSESLISWITASLLWARYGS
ncbi:MAG: glycosyltransferase [Oscillospiraceae bacterium]|jgi:hypothetical protein|nr:glycosyltransferase [Oscillospiraceae bacterium]MCI1990265.1 glycosyltransferase [Oscillospiraceae bacterium]MCI2035475.1 glycosyltransferase [Oscillospiraceae bacterium]